MLQLAKKTWLQQEEFAYPNGGMTRKGQAICPDGKLRRVYAGIADTYFSIPAYTRIQGKRVKGFLVVQEKHDERFLVFKPNKIKPIEPIDPMAEIERLESIRK